MTSSRKIRLEVSRTVNTYAELWQASRTLFKIATEQEKGSTWTSMGSVLLTAFTLEAFFNHIGPRLFKAWDDMESLSPVQKLAVLSERLNIQFSSASRPGQTIHLLIRFRNALAHGKTEHISAPTRLVGEHFVDRSLTRGRPHTQWERLCNPKVAAVARADVEKVITRMHKAANIRDESPFMFGLGNRKASVAPDA